MTSFCIFRFCLAVLLLLVVIAALSLPADHVSYLIYSARRSPEPFCTRASLTRCGGCLGRAVKGSQDLAADLKDLYELGAISICLPRE